MSTKKEKQKTYYESIIEKGYSRRDFIKFATYMTAFMGLESSMIGQVVKAMETKKRIPVIWEHFQECTGCSESFIRSDHPLVADLIFDHISLDYTDTLMAASGHNAEEAKQESMKENYGNYILVVEGAIPIKDDGVYCTIAGRSAIEILKESAAGAAAILTFGSCSSWGGVQAAYPNPTGSVPVDEIITDKPIIRVPGCPPISEVMTGIVMHYATFGVLPELDALGRPKQFYGKRVHDSCYRRPNFDAGLYAESFDSQEAKDGYCLYKLGCRGPVSYNACGTMGWNNGVSFPIKSGYPCIGCSEPSFWDNSPFVERLENVPGMGIEATADKIGKIVVGAAVGGAVVHSIATNFAKKKEIRAAEKRGEENERNIKA
ncbi:Uptake [NiFe] hydrogenase, small subunit HyaA [hydrothermal vent metagenome]|uniref:Uptake [NiFe] hydrogenase, small subunit HyaA n=1 Tax=hydrothermal vent metagenome TaxID=652676 RepID=A0A3B0UYH1_9ZZZZ